MKTYQSNQNSETLTASVYLALFLWLGISALTLAAAAVMTTNYQW